MSVQSHHQLKITRGSIHICPAYATNASCRNFPCASLHVCRAWLAGNCRKRECPLDHSLRTAQNALALAAVGVKELPQCDENLRYEVAIIFPQLCIHYILGKCNQPTCFKLHLCKELLLNGRCTLPNCKLNHSLGPRERNILVKRGVKIPPENAIGNTSPRTLQTLFTDVLCADGNHVKGCPCKVPKQRTRTKKKAPGAAGAASVADSSESGNDDDNDDDNDTRSVHSQASSRPSNDFKLPVGASRFGGYPAFTAVPDPKGDAKFQYGANPYGGYLTSIAGAKNSVNSANASAAATGQRHGATANDWVSSLMKEARDSTAPVSDVYGSIKNVSSIVKYLLRRGGWAPWAEFIDHFKISPDFFAMMKWLLAKQKKDFSFTGQKADWIRPVNYKNQNAVPDEVLFHSVYINLGSLRYQQYY